MISKYLTLLLCSALLLGGCAWAPSPQNSSDALYQPAEQLAGLSSSCHEPLEPALVQSLELVPSSMLTDAPDRIGAGDRFRLTISGDADVLTGSYIVGANGRLLLPAGLDMPAAGRTRAAIETDLRQAMISAGLIRDIAGNVKLAQAEAAGVQVSVEGSVFEPGIVRIGERSAEARSAAADLASSGDFNAGRTLSIALRSAGGIRPDAAVHRIYLVRGKTYAVYDVTAALKGGDAEDPQLAAGDRVFVPSAACFQPDNVRPSRVTTPGVRVYISSLSRPSQDQREVGLPYGSRLIQGLIVGNCIGGSTLNASRKAILISRNPVTGKSTVTARSVERLVRRADRDAFNPYLMPGDAIACYDGAAMTFVDAVGLLSSLLAPAVILGLK